jgi:integrase
VLFLYVTGCRTGEAKALEWKQVDWTAHVIKVEAEQTKNDIARSIPVSDEVYACLKKTPEAKRVGVLFPVGCFRKAWQSACVRAGLGTLTKEKKRRIRVSMMDSSRMTCDGRQFAIFGVMESERILR